MTMRKGNSATAMVRRGLSGALLADLARCVGADRVTADMLWRA